jgi:hypothetical protein
VPSVSRGWRLRCASSARHTGSFFLVVGAVSLLAQTGGGLYWVVPALLAMIVVSIIGAWITLVEIVR